MKNRLTAGAGSAVENTTVPAHVRDGCGLLKGKPRQAALSLQRSEIQIHMFFLLFFYVLLLVLRLSEMELSGTSADYDTSAGLLF